MKLAKTRIALVVLAILAATVLVFTASGCGVVNRIRSKNQLNEAARAFREGRYVEAEQHSRRAAELDPNNKTAPMFIARTIHAQYRPGVQQPDNIAKANEAIQAYQEILNKNPQDEEAYKAIAYLYGAIKEEQKLRDWITSRASNDAVEPTKRAEAYIVLASKDWQCSFNITESTNVKVTTVDPTNNKATVSYKKPTDPKEFNQAQMCVKQGLSEAENAIKYDPNNESAWSYKTNLLLEASKLAEMDGKPDQKASFTKEYEAALKRTTELSAAAQKRKEEEAKQSASPPKG
ncbi:MAG TPA: heme biosynthesis HemY N-terminal domain-containing protein [Pyrinomonadaceae bacterium]|nr:heme biosynthesis HemY N-terminal domain-containing protein [Pyrinomonadaceae bacterium]